MNSNEVDSTRGARGGPADQARGLVSKTKSQVSDFAGEVRDEAAQLADEARHQVNDLVDRRKAATADNLGNLAGALRDTARRLEQRDRGGLVTYADRWADQVEKASAYLRDRQMSEVMNDLEGFARRRPDVFLAGSFAAGILAARFLKSSSARGTHSLRTAPAADRAGHDMALAAGFPPEAGR